MEIYSKPGNSEKSIPKAHLKKLLIAVCIALIAVIASVRGLNVAQPMLAEEFSISQRHRALTINIYAFSLAPLLLPMGALGERSGSKKMLMAGLMIFVAAGTLAIAPSAKMEDQIGE